MGSPGSRLVTLVLDLARDVNTLLVGATLEDLAEIVPVLTQTAAHATARLAEEARVHRVAPDRWLAPKEAAAMLGTSVQSLNRRWRQLPFCRPGVTRGFRVSLAGLREYMARPCDSAETPTRGPGRAGGPRP